MPFLGTHPSASSTNLGKDLSVDEFDPSLGMASGAAFGLARQTFGIKPLQEMSELGRIRGHSGEGDPFWGISLGAMQHDEKTGLNDLRNMLEPDEANARFGIGEELVFNEPVTAAEAIYKRERKLKDLKLNWMRDQAKGFWKNTGLVGVELAADFTDPLGLLTILMPMTKASTVARAVTKYGSKAPYIIGAGETVAALSVPVTSGYFASKEFQYEFGPRDYGLALAGGAILGGTLKKWLFRRDLKKNVEADVQLRKETEETLNDMEEAIDHDTRLNEDVVDQPGQPTAKESAGTTTDKFNVNKATLGELVNKSNSSISKILHEILVTVARRGKDKIVKNNRKFELGPVEEELAKSNQRLKELDGYLKNPEKWGLDKDGIDFIRRAYKLLNKEIANIKKVKKSLLDEEAAARKAKDTPPKKELTPAEEQELLEQKHALNNLKSDLMSKSSGANKIGLRGGKFNLQTANSMIETRLLKILGEGRDDLNYGAIGAAWSKLITFTNAGKKKFGVEDLENLFSNGRKERERKLMNELDETIHDDLDAMDSETISLDDVENQLDEDYNKISESDDVNTSPRTEEDYDVEVNRTRESSKVNLGKLKSMLPDRDFSEMEMRLQKAQTPEELQQIEDVIQEFIDCQHGL